MSKHLTPVIHVKLTTTQRDALTAEEGMEIYNLTTDRLEFYDGTQWRAGGSTGNLEAGLYMYTNGGTPTNSRLAMQITHFPTTFPVSIPNSRFYSRVPPSGGNVIFTIKKELFNNYGTAIDIGTITFVDGNSNGSVSFTTQETLAKGDLLYIQTPVNVNGMEDVFLYVRGYSGTPLYV